MSQTYTHDPVGVLSTTAESGLGTDSYAYDPRYRLTGDALAGGSPASRAWSYDGATEILASSTTLNGGTPITTTRAYARDNSLRTLLQVQGGTTQHNLSFGYDAAGNRTGQQDSITGQNLSFTYNEADRLTKYGPIWTYSYNGDGLRTSKAGLNAARFTWDMNASLPELLSDGTAQYLYGPGGLLLEQIQSSAPYYYHADRQGSVRAVSGADGTLQATYQYDAYGNTTASTGSLANPFRYAGGYRDAESGLYYLQARYYDPATQQFLSVDPLLAVTGQAYTYVGGSPTNAIDPSGRIACPRGTSCFEPVRRFACDWFDWFCTPQEQADRDYAAAQQAVQQTYDACALAGVGCDEWTQWLHGLQGAGVCLVGPGQSPYGVSRPQGIQDRKLQNIVNDLYKGEGGPGQIGTGSTADAIRNELITGRPTFGKFHAQKGAQYIRALSNWLAKNPNAAPADVAAANALLQDLLAALGGQ